jgi:Phenazine biosynthesis-like protein
MKRRYVTADVFTDRMFGGNPLAVVIDAEGLSTAQMQSLALEFNYAETSFVLPPKDPRHTAHVRACSGISSPRGNGAFIKATIWGVRVYCSAEPSLPPVPRTLTSAAGAWLCWKVRSRCEGSVAAATLLLNGRAGHGSIRAKHAAVTRLGAQQRFALRALVEILAGVGGHGLGTLLTASRAGNDRLQYDAAHALYTLKCLTGC